MATIDDLNGGVTYVTGLAHDSDGLPYLAVDRAGMTTAARAKYDEWLSFHTTHPGVWEAFEEVADRRIARGLRFRSKWEWGEILDLLKERGVDTADGCFDGVDCTIQPAYTRLYALVRPANRGMLNVRKCFLETGGHPPHGIGHVGVKDKRKPGMREALRREGDGVVASLEGVPDVGALLALVREGADALDAVANGHPASVMRITVLVKRMREVLP